MPMVYKVWSLNDKFVKNTEPTKKPEMYGKSQSALNLANKRGISKEGLDYRARHQGENFNWTQHGDVSVGKTESASKKGGLAHPGIVSNPWKSSLGINFL